MRFAAKRDACEPAVIEALKAYGWIVEQISSPGAPDLVVWKRERIVFIECKSKVGKPTKAQRQWQGPPPITLRSRDQALQWAQGER